MKINDRISTSTSPAGKPGGTATSGQNSRVRSASLGSGSFDKLQLSNLSSQLSNLQSDSPFRVSQVSQLSAAVVSGRYQVDAAAVSHGLIEEHLRG